MPDVSTRLEDLTEEQQTMIVEFMQENFIPIEAINPQHSAYGLKQRFSREHFYVTQEQFTQAMAKAGFRVHLAEDGSTYFNIGQRSPDFKRT